MRNVFLLLLLALIGFGFCVAFNINLTRELLETRAQLAQAQSEQRALEGRYHQMVQQNNHLATQTSTLSAENADLQRQLELTVTERQLLSKQVITLQNQMALFRQANPLLDSLASASGKQLAAVLLLPVLPISLGIAYLRKHLKRAAAAARKTRAANAPNTYQVALTREELDWIERRRRG